MSTPTSMPTSMSTTTLTDKSMRSINKTRRSVTITKKYNELKARFLSEDELIQKFINSSQLHSHSQYQSHSQSQFMTTSILNNDTKEDDSNEKLSLSLPRIGFRCINIALIKDIIANKHYTIRIGRKNYNIDHNIDYNIDQNIDHNICNNIHNNDPLHTQKKLVIDCKLAEIGGIDYKSQLTKDNDTVYYPDHVYDYKDYESLKLNGDLVYGVTYCNNNGNKQQIYIKINIKINGFEFDPIPINESDTVFVNDINEINKLDKINENDEDDEVDNNVDVDEIIDGDEVNKFDVINEINEVSDVEKSKIQYTFVIKNNNGDFVEAIGAKYCCIGLTGNMLNKIVNMIVKHNS